MIEWIIKRWIKHKTKNFTAIPLFLVTFDYHKYKTDGKEGSCMINIHPSIATDRFVIDMLRELADYIRDNCDLDAFTKL